jgi:type II secretory pathway component GspD/PulD (secretin)
MDGDMINIKAKIIINIVSGQETQQGLTVPRISSHEAQTTMNVKSGETIVIGGLIKKGRNYE